MRGADKLIALRRTGRRPAVVFLNDYPTPAAFLDGTTVDISGDDLVGLDLRFLVGLTVSTGSETVERAKAIFDACKRAGASAVACCHAPKDRREETQFLEIWNGTHTA